MMEIIGSGPPLVLVPGMQGRWEWMAATVTELAKRFTVVTYSLCGEPGSRTPSTAISRSSTPHAAPPGRIR